MSVTIPLSAQAETRLHADDSSEACLITFVPTLEARTYVEALMEEVYPQDPTAVGNPEHFAERMENCLSMFSHLLTTAMFRPGCAGLIQLQGALRILLDSSRITREESLGLFAEWVQCECSSCERRREANKP